MCGTRRPTAEVVLSTIFDINDDLDLDLRSGSEIQVKTRKTCATSGSGRFWKLWNKAMEHSRSLIRDQNLKFEVTSSWLNAYFLVKRTNLEDGFLGREKKEMENRALRTCNRTGPRKEEHQQRSAPQATHNHVTFGARA